MTSFQIPQALIRLLTERRVIPFIGAGFSKSLSLPTWDELLERIADEFDDSLGYKAIKEMCNRDPLQIAEYYFLKSDRNIGPLRHRLSAELQPSKEPVFSGAHVELVNLGAPLIYTTNFDDLLEETFEALGVPFDAISLPRHIARASATRTQIIKFHGDLRYDETLVLTESAYHARLNFESPLDLKFRSDILGRSVLFMGYSFRDINIRVIWFKLMQMMKDISPSDRPQSYIVRVESNSVLDTLYDAVGLKTIVLDPDRLTNNRDERNELLANELLASFVYELAQQVSPTSTIPGANEPMFVSTTLIADAERSVSVRSSGTWSSERDRSIMAKQIVDRRLPSSLTSSFNDTMVDLSMRGVDLSRAALRSIATAGPSSHATFVIVASLLSNRAGESLPKEPDVPWAEIWREFLGERELDWILTTIRREAAEHAINMSYPHLAWGVDILLRIIRGQLASPDDQRTRLAVTALLLRIGKTYSAALHYEPDLNGAPAPGEIAKQIEAERERDMEAYEAQNLPPDLDSVLDED